MRPTDDECEREGCSFFPELVLIGGAALPARYCGDACADFEWLRLTLADAEPSKEIADALQTLNGLRRLLDGRNEPSDIGPLLGRIDA
ncbi:hypothetical protein OG735_07030 [Streptomyces sp. NBC_01210]|uniref:hypothetical protein n=1 Tax=Streptomyces sp. NBC_01210 TaxID=2903774 RepID=UPI002E13334F|nr:hypothetical protein OG735_07030 [Streptomyces sp. NBC_01210]